ncbi:hypothetical protein [Psychrobacter sp. I-STPA10]|uniref:hypothetical protein n=1 Tax=Psychrobacter sp. I-STPA10 TaxID=2585769 RepID=UPI001E561140|nr:hypothetical protein [Psychrobacter sp. I-STPA10]
MASKPTNIQTDQVLRKRQRIQTLLWFFMALIFATLTLLLWMSQASVASPAQVVKSPDTQETMATAKFDSPSQIASLHELDNEVTPISFDPLVRDMRQYPDEFKDKQFLKSHAGKWTVQVMDVSEYRIITEYLNSREDRDKFVFFRYRDESDQPRYILFYDTYPSAQMAMGSAKLTDFNLPANVRVIPEEINRYLSVIENYELSEPMQNLADSPVRKVKLQPTRREVPVRVPKQEVVVDNEPQRTAEKAAVKEQKPDNTNNNEEKQPVKSIKNSTNREDTLVVNEAREISAVEKEGAQAESDNTKSTAAAKKPPTKKETAATKKTNASAKDKSGADKVDSIKELIEEKTE